MDRVTGIIRYQWRAYWRRFSRAKSLTAGNQGITLIITAVLFFKWVSLLGAAADSLGPPRIGRLGYETAARHGTTSVLVDEESLLAARRFLWERVRVLAEPGASAALAALMSGRVAVHPGSTVVVVVSGGNNPALP